MKYFFMFLFFFLLQNCSKPKSVFICGDHVCINKTEAEQYFEENLSIEVKIINKRSKKNIDLVELNLKDDSAKKKEISVSPKSKTRSHIKILTNQEVKKIKKKINEKKKNKSSLLEPDNKKKSAKKNNKKIVKKTISKKINNNNKLLEKKNMNKKVKKIQDYKDNVNKQQNQVIDVCKIVKKCNIDEISKYLINQGQKRKFPDITTRQ